MYPHLIFLSGHVLGADADDLPNLLTIHLGGVTDEPNPYDDATLAAVFMLTTPLSRD